MMVAERPEDQVIAVICERLGQGTWNGKRDTRLAELGATSLDVVELALALEVAFEIEIGETELEHLKTVGDVVACVQRHRTV